MGKFSSKKRKGTRKQSFKNRRRVKKGGKDPTTSETETNEAEETDTNENAEEKNANENVEETDTNEAETNANENVEETDTNENAEEKNANEDAEETDTNENAKETDTNENAEEKNANEDAEEVKEGETTENIEDWKEGVSREEVETAEEKVKEIEDMDPDEINKLAKELADQPGTPLWAKALAKSGAAGTAAKFLNAHPGLKKALIDKGVEGIKNANVSGAASNTNAKNAKNATGNGNGTGAPGANTGAAAPGGSYTADDAGYQKFIKSVKTNPDTLKNVVYVNNKLTQIFLKTPNGWNEIKK